MKLKNTNVMIKRDICRYKDSDKMNKAKDTSFKMQRHKANDKKTHGWKYKETKIVIKREVKDAKTRLTIKRCKDTNLII